jgi:hypothetical protein
LDTHRHVIVTCWFCRILSLVAVWQPSLCHKVAVLVALADLEHFGPACPGIIVLRTLIATARIKAQHLTKLYLNQS